MAKMTVQFTNEMEEVVEMLAETRGVPKTQVLRNAVRLMKFLDDEGRGADLVLRNRKDGTERHLVLESQIASAADGLQDAGTTASRSA